MNKVINRNLDNLTRDYFRRTGAKKARKYLDKVRDNKAEDLAHLLRHHDEEGVKDWKEIELRDGFDDLLSFYSLIEIAIRIGYVPHPLPRAFHHQVLDDLMDRDVRRYYEKNYPLELPKLLRMRLTGDYHHLETRAKNGGGSRNEGLPSHRLFEAFLDLSGTLQGDEDIDNFLMMLDSFTLSDGSDLTDLLKVMAKPKQFMKSFSARQSQQSDLESSVHGFTKAVSFCEAFDDLLVTTGKYPVLQAGMWHFHAYWFNGLKKNTLDVFNKALTLILTWQGTKQGIEVHTRKIGKLRNRMSRVINGKYGLAMKTEIAH